MSISGVDPGIPVFADPTSRSATAVVALIDKDEFTWAQIVVSGLNGYYDYEAWRDTREGFQMGLAMAGVAAKLLPIAVTPFLAWCRITGAAPTERALDDFALAVSQVRSGPRPLVLAIVSKEEFDVHRRDVATLSACGDYESWVRHRQAMYGSAVSSDLRIAELPVLIGDFIKWSACADQFPQLSNWSIDRYAQLALEYFSAEIADEPI
jgi:hypothetical protein